MPLRVVHFGLPGPGSVCLERLVSLGRRPELYVLGPPKGDDQVGIVQQLEKYGIPYLQPAVPESLSSEGFCAKIAAAKPDLIIVTGYDLLLPAALLKIPSRGAINFHPSLLPRYRGYDPYFWTIANGELETGVTAHYMDERFDAGDVIAARKIELTGTETMGTLFVQLAHVSADLLIEILEEIEEGRVERIPQSQEGSTHPLPTAPRVTADHLALDPSRPAEEVLRFVRAANPFYGIFTTPGGMVIRIWEAEALSDFEHPQRAALLPGTLVRHKNTWGIVCSSGLLLPKVIQVGLEAIMSAEGLTPRLLERGLLY